MYFFSNLKTRPYFLAACLPGYERDIVGGNSYYGCTLCAVNTYNPNEDYSVDCYPCSSSKTTASLTGQADCLGRYTFQAKLTPRSERSTPVVHWQCLAVQYKRPANKLFGFFLKCWRQLI